MTGTKTNLGGKAEHDFGGSASATNEEQVSSAETPDPARDPENAEGNTERTKPAPVAPDKAFQAAPPLQEPMASGRDDPKESEHDHSRQRLHGVSAQRVQTPD